MLVEYTLDDVYDDGREQQKAGKHSSAKADTVQPVVRSYAQKLDRNILDMVLDRVAELDGKNEELPEDEVLKIATDVIVQHVKNFKASNRWLAGFKKRYNISGPKWEIQSDQVIKWIVKTALGCHYLISEG